MSAESESEDSVECEGQGQGGWACGAQSSLGAKTGGGSCRCTVAQESLEPAAGGPAGAHAAGRVICAWDVQDRALQGHSQLEESGQHLDGAFGPQFGAREKRFPCRVCGDCGHDGWAPAEANLPFHFFVFSVIEDFLQCSCGCPGTRFQSTPGLGLTFRGLQSELPGACL